MAEAPPADPPVETPPADWRESLPEEIRANPSLEHVSDVADLASQFINAQKTIGEGRITVPGADASPEETAAFYKAIGRPDSPEGYEIPEGVEADAELAKKFMPAFHKAGLTKEQAAEMVRLAVQNDLDRAQAFKKGKEEAREKGIAELRKEWGEAFDQQSEYARETARVMGIEGRLEELGLAYDVDFMKGLAKVGTVFAESAIRGQGPGSTQTTSAAAMTEITKIETSEEYRDHHHPAHKATMERYQRLMDIAFPGEVEITAPGSIEVGTG